MVGAISGQLNTTSLKSKLKTWQFRKVNIRSLVNILIRYVSETFYYFIKENKCVTQTNDEKIWPFDSRKYMKGIND